MLYISGSSFYYSSLVLSVTFIGLQSQSVLLAYFLSFSLPWYCVFFCCTKVEAMWDADVFSRAYLEVMKSFGTFFVCAMMLLDRYILNNGLFS